MDNNILHPDFLDYSNSFLQEQRKLRDKLYRKSKLQYASMADYEDYLRQAYYVDGLNDMLAMYSRYRKDKANGNL